MTRVKSQNAVAYTIAPSILGVQTAHEEEILKQAETILRDRMRRQSGPMTNPNEIGRLLCLRVGANAVESLGLVYLDTQHRIIELEELFTGTPDGCRISVPHVIRRCVQHRAVNVILYHNHPSGVPEPSEADHRVTEIVHQTLKPLDITLLDHIIVAGADYRSLREHHPATFG